MRLGGAFRRLIAVESFTDDRPPQRPQPASPASGARWGRPAQFDIGARPQPDDEGGRITASWLHENRIFRGVETHREYGRVAAIADGSVTAEAIRSVTFYLGEREVRRERRSGPNSVTPLIETIRDYVRLEFPFSLAGARGEPAPPETPPRKEPDYG